MTAKILEQPNYKALVVGPIYDKIEKLKKAESLFSDYDIIIFNGNLCYPFNLEQIRDRIQIMDRYLQSDKVYYNLGDYDLRLLNTLNKAGEAIDIQNWLKKHSNVIMINQNLIITCGGTLPQMSKRDLLDGLETSFISKVDNHPWHKWYGGGYGYIISNNPLTSKPPQFYNFSAQIGNIPSEESQVYAQEATPLGLGKTISL